MMNEKPVVEEKVLSATSTTPSNVPGGEELTEAEIRAAIRALVYRKSYNQRPDVRESRRRYNRKRQETIKLALQAYRKAKGGVA